MSFIIVDLKNTYHLTEKDGTKRFGEKHNMTNTIQFIRAKTYNNGFDSVYGSCSSEVVGYYRKKGNATFFGTVDLTEPCRYLKAFIYIFKRFSNMIFFFFELEESVFVVLRRA